MTCTSWTLWLLLFATLHSAVAEAADAREAYRRATFIAAAGGIGSVVGVPLVLGGVAVGIRGSSDPDLAALGFGMYVGGYALVGTGGAVLSGGSLAARHVLVKHGARVSAVPGALAWSTWGISAAMVFLPYLGDIPGGSWIALTSYVATLTLGTIQLVVNDHALRALPDGALDKRPIAFSVAPSIDPHGARINLVLSF